jgi:hypothetical protein
MPSCSAAVSRNKDRMNKEQCRREDKDSSRWPHSNPTSCDLSASLVSASGDTAGAPEVSMRKRNYI